MYLIFLKINSDYLSNSFNQMVFVMEVAGVCCVIVIANLLRHADEFQASKFQTVFYSILNVIIHRHIKHRSFCGKYHGNFLVLKSVI